MLRGCAMKFFKKSKAADTRDNLGRTLLHNAVLKDSFSDVKHLVEQGADVNACDNYGQAPLHFAVTFHSNVSSDKILLEMVKYLISNGAKIDTIANDGETPLHRAVFGEHLEIVKYLVESGANVA